MKIIVQAGGLGTRMKHLAETKPKSLIAAKYLPLIFHMFERFRGDEFVIVGDYKFDVFDNYLATFANDIRYVLIKAQTKGNAAGLKEAIALVPSGEPFMVIWSDIILSERFAVHDIKKGCQVGVADFPCSWSLVDGRLVHQQHAGKGVAGLYVFDDKGWFDGFPEGGSFTDWLANRGVPLHPLSLMGSIDVGTLEAYREIDTSANRCRPYNRIAFSDGRVTKTGLTPEAEKLIAAEVAWYARMQEYGFTAVPKLYGTAPLTMERIEGDSVFAATLDAGEKAAALVRIVDALGALHALDERPSSPWDLYHEYHTKTLMRLHGVARAIPFALDTTIIINGVNCVNVLRAPHRLRHAVQCHLMDTRYAPIHGDCQLTNILIAGDGRVTFIDPRGYFGASAVLGDVRYDWAKLYYSVEGNFDQFNIKNYELSIDERGVRYAIGSNGWEHLTGEMLARVSRGEANATQIELIHAVIWLSMASHAWEDFDSMCVAFYNGTLLLQRWMEEHGDGAA